MYRAVILDVDGTLVDSNDAHAHAWVDAFAESGRMVPFAHIRSLIGMGGDKLVDAAASRDEAPHSKPDPDIVRAALARTGCAAQDVIMLGDTPYDIEAAHRTGLGTIALRCGGWSDQALRGAVAIYDDPADLLE